ncbi:MAG: carboxypeptidase-like regulatory domain-containing protein [Chloroflexi bacterium]|nr:carboxypeptidase-like regulatory domain-containing protein [Chloroflexota bacterium]
MRRLSCAVLLLLLAATLLAPASIFAQTAQGSITGKVVNKSAGGDPLPAGLTVELVGLYDGAETGRTAPVGADGSYSFNNLAADGKSYVVTATFLGTVYGTDEISLTAAKPTATAELPIYNTTTDAAKVSLARNHLIVDFDSDNKLLVVMDVFSVANDGDRTYVGGDKKNAAGKSVTLSLRLPTGATHVQFVDGVGEQLAKVVDGVLVDTAPIAPGGRQLVISYFVPYQDGTGALLRALDYPVAKVSIVVRDVGAQITGEGLGRAQPLDIGGNHYQQLPADNVPANLSVGIRLTNIPDKIAAASTSATTAPAGTDKLGLAVGGLGALVLALGIAYPVLRRRRRAPLPPVESPNSDGEWERLVGEIAALDDDYEAGTLDEEQYQRLRVEKKAQLLVASRQSRKA